MSSPTDISGLVLWLKASSLLLSDGDPVSTWTDSSGGGHDASQGTSGFRPVFKTGILNGKPSVRFDGSDDHMNGLLTHSGNSLTVFLLMQRISNVGTGSMSFHDPVIEDYGTPLNLVVDYNGGSGLILQSYRNGSLSTASHPGSGVAFLYATKFDGVNNTVYLNTVAQTPVASTGSFGFNKYVIGSRWISGAAEWVNIDLVEAVVYDKSLDDAEMTLFASYISDEYGLFRPDPSFRVPRLRPAIFKPGLAR